MCRVVISNLITRFDNTVARSVKSYRESIFPSYRVCIALNERNCIIERGDRKDIFVWIYSDTYTRILQALRIFGSIKFEIFERFEDH